MNWTATVADQDFRKQFGARLKVLRKKHRLTQKELANSLGISFGQLNKYESGLTGPSAELLIKIADRLDVSLDTLLTGHQPDNVPVSNVRLVERFKELEHVDAEDQETAIKLLDALIIKHRASELLTPFEK